ncbi:MAG: hypothetical protein NT098_02165 [Candidatus Parcubacteria bacterium]|nr:hypothetical protein [Candidatus Parcubacteria bacterium]
MNTLISCSDRPLEIEVVERKGIGHPDSLADIIAEDFSNKYSLYCLENFGTILNYWFDKVTLSGGVSELTFGKHKILKESTIYLFGRATVKFGNHIIPIESLFKESCFSVFYQIFGNDFPKESIRFTFDINTAIGADHDKAFYFPRVASELKTFENFTANDTVVCHGYFPYTKAEYLTINLENFINSAEFKNKYPCTGWDVKVLVVRENNLFRITICIPFIAEKTDSLSYYNRKKDEIKKDLEDYVEHEKIFSEKEYYEFHLNTKDKGDFAYLVSYGSALDKGDYGAVGRGNRYNGVISVNRGTNVEAVNGKNSRNHSGKLYTILAYSIASYIYNQTSQPCQVVITTDNGCSLNEPTMVLVRFDDKEFNIREEDELKMKEYIKKKLSEIDKLSIAILGRNPVLDFKNTFIYD